jgi:HEAT repeats/PBS lyase HEAT-like repeat
MPLVGATAVPLSAALLLAAMGAAAGCDTSGFRPGAESVLDIFQEPTPQEAVALATDRYDADARYRGTLLLSTQPFAGEELYMRLFEQNSRDDDAGVRTAATRAIANHGGPTHTPLLIERLKDADRLVRIEAARGLQRIHNPEAIDPLLQAIDEEEEVDPAVRSEAADALGQYAENEVLEALIATLDDANLAVNSRTLASLRTLTGQDYGYDRAAWQSWYRSTAAPFAGRSVYTFPAFSREKSFIEMLPFVPPPPNEASTPPAGMELPGG